MKKVLSFFLAVILVVIGMLSTFTMKLSAATAEMDTSWYDSAKEEFVLTSSPQLIGFSYLVRIGNNFSGKTVRLGADITINEMDLSNISAVDTSTLISWYDFGEYEFAGTFDGDNYTISGLYCLSDRKTDYAGLFGKPAKTTVIRDLAIVNSCLVALDSRVGAIFGDVSNCSDGLSLSNLYVDVDIYANKSSVTACGGLIGASRDGDLTINSCVYAGNIVVAGTAGSIGGLIGNAFCGETAINIAVNDCAVYGTISGMAEAIGGIIGWTDGALEISHSVVTASMPASVSRLGAFYGILLSTLDLTGNLYTAEAIRPIPSYDDAPLDSSKPVDAQYSMVTVDSLHGVSAMAVLTLHGMDQWKAVFNGFAVPKTLLLMSCVKEEASSLEPMESTKAVGYQVSKARNGKFSIRLVAVVDSLNYSAVGFYVEANGENETIGYKSRKQTTSDVYEKLVGYGEEGQRIDYIAEDLGGAYIFALNINNIPVDSGKIVFKVSTFNVRNGVESTDGEAVTFTFDTDRIS